MTAAVTRADIDAAAGLLAGGVRYTPSAMPKKLADRLQVPYEKMPSNIVELYGNSCSPTLAVNLTHNLGERLTKEKFLLCLAGFGAGLSWSSLLMEMGHLDFCETIDFQPRPKS